MHLNEQDVTGRQLRRAVRRLFAWSNPFRHWNTRLISLSTEMVALTELSETRVWGAVDSQLRSVTGATESRRADNDGNAVALESADPSSGVTYHVVACCFWPIATVRGYAGRPLYTGLSDEWRRRVPGLDLGDSVATSEQALLRGLAPAFEEVGYHLVNWQRRDLHRHVWYGPLRGLTVWDYVFYLGTGD